MPLGKGMRFRVKHTTKSPVRLAFRGDTVVEATRMKKMTPKSKMPKGAGMSPHGDIGASRQMEGAKVGGAKLFKGAKVVTTEGRFGRLGK